MHEENDWTRTAMALDAVLNNLLCGTHGVFAGSDSVTVLTNTWAATVVELRQIQKQCYAYGEMCCQRVPDTPNTSPSLNQPQDWHAPYCAIALNQRHACSCAANGPHGETGEGPAQ
jgi:hypothetical protein